MSATIEFKLIPLEERTTEFKKGIEKINDFLEKHKGDLYPAVNLNADKKFSISCDEDEHDFLLEIANILSDIGVDSDIGIPSYDGDTRLIKCRDGEAFEVIVHPIYEVPFLTIPEIKGLLEDYGEKEAIRKLKEKITEFEFFNGI